MRGKWKRIVIGAVLPVLIANLLLNIYSAAVFKGPIPPGFDGFYKQIILEGYIYSLVNAVVLGGVQSVLYSLIMEKLINPKVKYTSLVLVYSSLLMAASVSLAGLATIRPVEFIYIGIITGFIVGWVLRVMYLKSKYPLAKTSDSF